MSRTLTHLTTMCATNRETRQRLQCVQLQQNVILRSFELVCELLKKARLDAGSKCGVVLRAQVDCELQKFCNCAFQESL